MAVVLSLLHTHYAHDYVKKSETHGYEQGCTDPILRLDICPGIDKIAGSGIEKINRSTGRSSC